MQNETELINKLQAPVPESEKKYRVGQVTKGTNKGSVLTYVDARFCMDRLDEVIGVLGWSVDYKEVNGVTYCGVTIHIDGSFVTKWDCGCSNNDFEEEKTVASDSFKRACVKWGIGRDLYSGTTYYTDLEVNSQGKCYLPKGWKPPSHNGAVRTTATQTTPNEPQSSNVVPFKAGNNKGKTYAEVDMSTLKFIQVNSKGFYPDQAVASSVKELIKRTAIMNPEELEWATECNDEGLKEAARQERERRYQDQAEPEAVANEDIPF